MSRDFEFGEDQGFERFDSKPRKSPRAHVLFLRCFRGIPTMAIEEIYLTEKEQQIVDSIGQSQRETLQKLNVTSLTKYKSQIVGFRSEDLFFFLDCLNKGRIVVGNETDKGCRGKCQGGLFLTPNPESPQFKYIDDEVKDNFKRPLGGHLSFHAATRENVKMYSEIALLNPIHREVRPLIKDEQSLLNSCWGYLKGSGLIQVEEFYDALIDEIKEGASFNYKNRSPIYYTLGQYLNPQDKEFVTQLFNRVKCRKGIIIGFNEQLVERYGLPTVGDGYDIVFNVPEGHINLDTILGFETLGDYEEEVVGSILKR